MTLQVIGYCRPSASYRFLRHLVPPERSRYRNVAVSGRIAGALESGPKRRSRRSGAAGLADTVMDQNGTNGERGRAHSPARPFCGWLVVQVEAPVTGA